MVIGRGLAGVNRVCRVGVRVSVWQPRSVAGRGLPSGVEGFKETCRDILRKL